MTGIQYSENQHTLFWGFQLICLFCKLRQKFLIKLFKNHIQNPTISYSIKPFLNCWNRIKAELLNLHLPWASQLQSYLQYILSFCYQVAYKVCFSLQSQSSLPASYQCLPIKAIFPSINIEQFRNNMIINIKYIWFCYPLTFFANRHYSIWLKTIHHDPFMHSCTFHVVYTPVTSDTNGPRAATLHKLPMSDVI